jgi:hypothetical protein
VRVPHRLAGLVDVRAISGRAEARTWRRAQPTLWMVWGEVCPETGAAGRGRSVGTSVAGS